MTGPSGDRRLRRADETVVIHEIYASIQGESTWAGLPCTFVRTTACNLRCRWCDTTAAFTGGQRMTVSDVIEAALATGTPLVELTGGEPLLQAGTHTIMRALCDAGRTVLIETSGERDISTVDPRVHRIMDLKAPGSGECERNRWENIAHLTKRDEVKFVLADRADYEWARDVIAKHELGSRAGSILMSTVFGELAPRDLVTWVLEDGLDVRVQLQMHKYIWPPETTGV